MDGGGRGSAKDKELGFRASLELGQGTGWVNMKAAVTELGPSEGKPTQVNAPAEAQGSRS